MAGRPKGSVPALVHHKPSGRARVRINGRDHCLGKWGSPEAKTAYDRLITEFLATRRISPDGERGVHVGPAGITTATPEAPPVAAESAPSPTSITVAEVLGLYLEHCATYYRTADGKRRTSTYDNARGVGAVSEQGPSARPEVTADAVAAPEEAEGQRTAPAP